MKITVDLSPEALAVIERVQATCRTLRLPIGSRASVIERALRDYDKRHLAAVKQAFAEAGDLLSDRDHAAVEALT